MDEDHSPIVAIVEQLAAAKGVDPLQLQPPLHHATDTDALERVLESAGADLTVSFTYDGHTVHVRGDGTIMVDAEELADESQPTLVS